MTTGNSSPFLWFTLGFVVKHIWSESSDSSVKQPDFRKLERKVSKLDWNRLELETRLQNIEKLSAPHSETNQVGESELSKLKQNTLVSGGLQGTLRWTTPELSNESSNKAPPPSSE